MAEDKKTFVNSHMYFYCVLDIVPGKLLGLLDIL